MSPSHVFRHLAIRCVQEKKVEESQEKLHTFVTDLRLKLEDRAKSPPAPGRLGQRPGAVTLQNVTSS